MSDYLIWSNEHRGWWAPGRAGYVRRVEDAGRYTQEQALGICTGAIIRPKDKPLNELPVRLEDVLFMFQRHQGLYPGHDPDWKEEDDTDV